MLYGIETVRKSPAPVDIPILTGFHKLNLHRQCNLSRTKENFGKEKPGPNKFAPSQIICVCASLIKPAITTNDLNCKCQNAIANKILNREKLKEKNNMGKKIKWNTKCHS